MASSSHRIMKRLRTTCRWRARPPGRKPPWRYQIPVENGEDVVL